MEGDRKDRRHGEIISSRNELQWMGETGKMHNVGDGIFQECAS